MTPPPGPPLRLVIFDVDGTLLDSRAHIVACMSDAFAEAGHPPPEAEAIVNLVGLSLQEMLARLAPGLDAAGQAGVVEAYRSNMPRVFATAPPLFPGAREVLTALAARDEVLLGIATGKSRRGLDLILEGHGMVGRFHNIQVSDHHPSKPHPSMLLAALSETGVDAAQAVMVGDTEYDIEMGRAAGIASVGVSWGSHSGDRLAAAGAAEVIDDFAALPAVLDGLWGI